METPHFLLKLENISQIACVSTSNQLFKTKESMNDVPKLY